MLQSYSSGLLYIAILSYKINSQIANLYLDIRMELCYDMFAVITDVFICWSSPLIWSRFCSWNILVVFWLAGRHTAWPTDAPCPPCPSREAWAGPKQLDGLSWVHHSFLRDEASFKNLRLWEMRRIYVKEKSLFTQDAPGTPQSQEEIS